MADYKKPDHWQLQARKEGYPARSVYKLKELNEKFALLKNQSNLRVLDIGAAPGSWSLYILREFAKRKGQSSGFLAAADLSPLLREFDKGLFDGENFFFIQGDITNNDIRKQLFSKGPYSLIISDAAPATMGNHTVDAARSLALAEEVLYYAENALISGGNLVVKVFQGGDSGELLKRMRTIFKTAKTFKPQACRGESVETYFVGLERVSSCEFRDVSCLQA